MINNDKAKRRKEKHPLSEIPGRPLIYATTKQFLEVFDLKDLKDLPTPKEIESLENASSENPE